MEEGREHSPGFFSNFTPMSRYQGDETNWEDVSVQQYEGEKCILRAIGGEQSW